MSVLDGGWASRAGVSLLMACALWLQGCASGPPLGMAPSMPPPRVLDLRLAGAPVVADLHRPAGKARGAVVLAHGFGRSRHTMSGHAVALAEAGLLAVVPDLPFGADAVRSARALSELVEALRAGTLTPAEGPSGDVVLVGFSAGALAVLLAAATPGVVGLVALDPVDRILPGDAEPLGEQAAARTATEAWIVRAPPSRCNAGGSAAGWSTRLRATIADDRIEGASHCDFESPSGGLCAWACGAAEPARQARVRAALLAAVDRWLPP